MISQLGYALHQIPNRPDGRLQVAAGPVGYLQYTIGLGAPVIIILGNQLECLFDVFHRCGKITLHLGVVGAGQGNHRWQGLKLCIVRYVRTIQASFSILQAQLAGFRFARISECPTKQGAKHGADANDLFWQLLHPTQPGGHLETFIHPLPSRFSQPRRPDKIPGCDGVVKRRAQVAVLFMPLAGAQVEFGEFFGFSQALPQQFGKEMVIAIPTSLVIQWDNEQVRAFEIFQGFLPGSRRRTQNSVTKGPAHAVEDGCSQ